MTIKTLDGQAVTFDFGAELAEIVAVTKETVDRIARAQENGTIPAAHSVREVSIESEFNGRFTNRMGDACYRRLLDKGVCRYSRPLWPFATAEQRHETIVHEVCHILAFHVFKDTKIKGHGREWKLVMRLAGYPGNRCHVVPTFAAKKAFVYECDCCGRRETFTAKFLNRGFHFEGESHRCGGVWHQVAEGVRGGREMHAQVALRTSPAPVAVPAYDEATGSTYTGTTAHRIEQFLAGHRGEWFTPNDIAKAIGKSVVTVRRYAPKLVAQGRIKETRGSGLGYSVGF